jgi:hypothetical protein
LSSPLAWACVEGVSVGRPNLYHCTRTDRALLCEVSNSFRRYVISACVAEISIRCNKIWGSRQRNVVHGAMAWFAPYLEQWQQVEAHHSRRLVRALVPLAVLPVVPGHRLFRPFSWLLCWRRAQHSMSASFLWLLLYDVSPRTPVMAREGSSRPSGG